MAQSYLDFFSSVNSKPRCDTKDRPHRSLLQDFYSDNVSSGLLFVNEKLFIIVNCIFISSIIMKLVFHSSHHIIMIRIRIRQNDTDPDPKHCF